MIPESSRLSDRPANPADDLRQAGIGDEHSRPDTLDQLGLLQHTRPVLDQQLQQLECLRREMGIGAAPNELPRVDVECAVGKSNLHCVTR